MFPSETLPLQISNIMLKSCVCPAGFSIMSTAASEMWDCKKFLLKYDAASVLHKVTETSLHKYSCCRCLASFLLWCWIQPLCDDDDESEDEAASPCVLGRDSGLFALILHHSIVRKFLQFFPVPALDWSFDLFSTILFFFQPGFSPAVTLVDLCVGWWWWRTESTAPESIADPDNLVFSQEQTLLFKALIILV